MFIFAAVGYILQDGAHGPFLSKKLSLNGVSVYGMDINQESRNKYLKKYILLFGC